MMPREWISAISLGTLALLDVLSLAWKNTWHNIEKVTSCREQAQNIPPTLAFS